jgi:anti-sigma factor ChrR (cupin superfamily)
MSDIVERLRAGPNGKHDPMIHAEMREAAGEIERLRAALGRLLDSLPPDLLDRAYYEEIIALSET